MCCSTLTPASLYEWLPILSLRHSRYSGVPVKTVAIPKPASSGRSETAFQMITIDIKIKNTGTKG